MPLHVLWLSHPLWHMIIELTTQRNVKTSDKKGESNFQKVSVVKKYMANTTENWYKKYFPQKCPVLISLSICERNTHTCDQHKAKHSSTLWETPAAHTTLSVTCTSHSPTGSTVFRRGQYHLVLQTQRYIKNLQQL